MSPAATQFHAKRDNNVVANGLCAAPPPLKINKDSHFIKKSSPSPSSSSSSSTLAMVTKPPQRHPVIIYTHSPKIIHTHPRDFMALVQKLTGLSRSDEDAAAAATNPVNPSSTEEENKSSRKIVVGNEDNDSSSVITDENCSTSTSTGGDVVVVVGGGGHHHQHHHQANSSCFVQPQPQPQQTNNPYNNIPVFTQNYSPSDHHNFFCANQPAGFYNYNTDSLFCTAPNITPSISSSSTFQGINDFPTSDY